MSTQIKSDIKRDIIHALELMREDFELVERRSEVNKFKPRTALLQPTLSRTKMAEVKIESIVDIALAWPEDDRDVRLTWVHEGVVLTARIMGKPVTNETGEWKCSVTSQVKRDGVLIVETESAIDVEFDNTPRPPASLIDHLIAKIDEGTVA